MLIYVTAIAIIGVGLLIFAKKGVGKLGSTVERQFDYALSKGEQESFIEAAERCKKENSPITDEQFCELSLEGSEMVNTEKFRVIEDKLKGCDCVEL